MNQPKKPKIRLNLKSSKKWIIFHLSIDVTSLSAGNLLNISKRLSQRLYFSLSDVRRGNLRGSILLSLKLLGLLAHSHVCFDDLILRLKRLYWNRVITSRWLTVIIAVTAVNLNGSVHAAHGWQWAPSARCPWQHWRQQTTAPPASISSHTDSHSTLTNTARAERGQSCHLIGREWLGEGGSGRQAGEVGRDLMDGADGAWTYVDGHVLLDGDG